MVDGLILGLFSGRGTCTCFGEGVGCEPGFVYIAYLLGIGGVEGGGVGEGRIVVGCSLGGRVDVRGKRSLLPLWAEIDHGGAWGVDVAGYGLILSAWEVQTRISRWRGCRFVC